MGNEKIQSLIQTLKEHGVQQGEEDGRRIVDLAHKKADEILAAAKAQAESIVSKADKDADQTLKRLRSSLEIAASQFVGNLKKVVEEKLLTLPLKSKLTETMKEPDYLKNLIADFVKSYAANPQHADIQVLLPAGAHQDLRDFVIELMGQYYGKDNGGKLSLAMESEGVRFGFQVDRKDGNVRFDFTDEAFLSLFLRFLTPGFRELFSNIKSSDIKSSDIKSGETARK
jgi:V/A-type H+-transporting ATPase subunit E